MSINEIVAKNYDLYRKWFDRSLDLIWKLPPELRSKADPMAEVSKAENKSSVSAVKSVCSGIRDTVSITDRYSASDIAVVDKALEQDNLPTLTSMRLLFSKEIVKLLKLPSIDNERDYYTLKAL